MTKQELEQCINEYGKDIYSFCRQLTGNRQEADDLYQDTFLKVMQLQRLNMADNPKSYLLSIALGIWKNRRRKFAWRKRIADMVAFDGQQEILEAKAPEASPEELFLEREERELVCKLVATLPEKQKICVLLFYMEDLSVREIADCLKIPEGTVKSRLYQARKYLEKELEDVLDE